MHNAPRKVEGRRSPRDREEGGGAGVGGVGGVVVGGHDEGGRGHAGAGGARHLGRGWGLIF